MRYTPKRPKGMQRKPCIRAECDDLTVLRAHGPHPWEYVAVDNTRTQFWCAGLDVHPHTMIGGSHG